MRATASIAALGAFALALALAGCATTPKPHPIVAEATPAGAETSAATEASGTSEKPRRGEGTSEHAARQTNRALGWIAISIGAEAAVVAGVTSLMMLHYQGERSADCDANKACSSAGFNANAQIGALGGWNAGAYAVAAVGLGTGLFLLLTNPADGSTRSAVGVGATPGGLMLRGSF
jgi:hypothetical protein